MRDVFVLVSFAAEDSATLEQAQEFAADTIAKALEVSHFDINGCTAEAAFECGDVKLIGEIVQDYADQLGRTITELNVNNSPGMAGQAVTAARQHVLGIVNKLDGAVYS